MINIETLLSSFDERGTLLKWLKAVEKALNEATLTSVDVVTISSTKIQFKFNFEDGTTLTTPSITLPKGDKGDTGEAGATGQTGATGVGIANVTVNASNHLIVTLTNQTEIDAGKINVSSGVLTPEALVQIVEGSEHIVVDINEAGDKVVVKLDEDTAEQVEQSMSTATLSLDTNTDTDPVIKMEYIQNGEQVSTSVAFDKDSFEIQNNHLKSKSGSDIHLYEHRFHLFGPSNSYVINATAITTSATAISSPASFRTFLNNYGYLRDLNGDFLVSADTVYEPISIQLVSSTVYRVEGIETFFEFDEARQAIRLTKTYKSMNIASAETVADSVKQII